MPQHTWSVADKGTAEGWAAVEEYAELWGVDRDALYLTLLYRGECEGLMAVGQVCYPPLNADSARFIIKRFLEDNPQLARAITAACG